jgi:NADH dehydrogenase
MDGSRTILIVGATGGAGEPVARRLLAEGFAVRLLARDPDRARARFGPGYQYCRGEVGDRAALERALPGCHGVHVNLSGGSERATIEAVELHGTTTLAELAARHGLDRLTYVSGYLTQERFAAKHFESRIKVAAERAIARSGVPFTIFKPTYFMETLPRHVRGRRAIALGRRQRPLHMVAGDDFGRMVAAAFRTPEAAGRELFVQGPEAVTIADALRLYCSIVAPGTRVLTVPLPVMAAVDRLLLRGQLRRTVDLMRLMQRVGELGDPAEANRLLGAPATTLAQWCRDRAAGDG